MKTYGIADLSSSRPAAKFPYVVVAGSKEAVKYVQDRGYFGEAELMDCCSTPELAQQRLEYRKRVAAKPAYSLNDVKLDENGLYYAELRDETGSLLIAATLDYIIDAVKVREYNVPSIPHKTHL